MMTCPRCGRRARIVLTPHPERMRFRLIWEPTLNRPADITDGVTVDELNEADFGCGYDQAAKESR